MGWGEPIPAKCCSVDNTPRERPAAGRSLRPVWCSVRTRPECSGCPSRRRVRGTPKRPHRWDGADAFPARAVCGTTLPGSGPLQVGPCGRFGVPCARGPTPVQHSSDPDPLSHLTKRVSSLRRSSLTGWLRRRDSDQSSRERRPEPLKAGSRGRGETAPSERPAKGPAGRSARGEGDGGTVYEDRTLVCRDCGEEFVFSAGEQAFFARKGLQHLPQRCAACRASARRTRLSSGAREYHAAVCSMCGGQAVVPFAPRADRPVYCSTCFDKVRAPSAGSAPA